MITTFTALFGVFGFIFQSVQSQKTQQAKFIVELSEKFYDNKDFQKLMNLLEKEYSEDDDSRAYISEIASKYLDFFESIYVVVEQGLISLSIIDNLFAYRFFCVANNPYIQKNVLTPYYKYYGNIIKLHYMWKKYRIKNGEPIAYNNSDLSRVFWYRIFIKDKK